MQDLEKSQPSRAIFFIIPWWNIFIDCFSSVGPSVGRRFRRLPSSSRPWLEFSLARSLDIRLDGWWGNKWQVDRCRTPAREWGSDLPPSCMPIWSIVYKEGFSDSYNRNLMSESCRSCDRDEKVLAHSLLRKSVKSAAMQRPLDLYVCLDAGTFCNKSASQLVVRSGGGREEERG